MSLEVRQGPSTLRQPARVPSRRVAREPSARAERGKQTPKVTLTRNGGPCRRLGALQLLKHARKPAAKARRKSRRIAKQVFPELIPEPTVGTAMSRLRRQRPQTQATSLGGELILVGVVPEETGTPPRTDDRSKLSPLAPLCG